jgi:hypothetical protein
MMNEFIPYDLALEMKQLDFDEPCFGNFYTKPNCKMFGVDEKGRHYTIKNTPKKLYTLGEHFVLNDSNVINAPLYQQAFRWFREKYQLVHEISWSKSKGGVSFDYDIFSLVLPTDDELGDEDDIYIEKPMETYDSLAGKTFRDMEFDSFEGAELACLIKLIEICKKYLTV